MRMPTAKTAEAPVFSAQFGSSCLLPVMPPAGAVARSGATDQMLGRTAEAREPAVEIGLA